MNNFYNTISLEGKDLSRAVNEAKTQADRILLIFKAQGIAMTPDHVHRLYIQYFYSVPLTSIRRAIHNLTDAEYLEKTNRMAMGRYGKPNYKWKLKSK